MKAALASLFGAALALFAAAAAAQAPVPKETPFFAERVRTGALPPVAERLPQAPWVVDRFAGSDGPGRSGGDLGTIMATPRDVRLMVVYGYARLIGHDFEFRLRPDILESYTVEEGRIFTFRLRKGHRWSDGKPFTTEDFRYFWEDVANNRELSPSGPPLEMMVDDRPPTVEILDELTVRYTWHAPNPYFLQAQARPSPLFIYRPAHYLRQFHAKHSEGEELQKRVRESRQRNWAALHNRMDDMYRNENRDLPSLQPWVLATDLPAQRFVFERNPFYHRVDTQGVQLPYIDRVIVNVASASLISLKAGSGESDLQARYIRFDNYTFLRQGAKQFKFDVRLWDTATGAQIALYPNLNYNDRLWAQVMREANFRRALSRAIDREEINEILYIGLAVPGNNTVRTLSPLHREEFRMRHAGFDVREANRLLDKIEIELPDGRKGDIRRRNDQGVRLLPDGRPMTIVIETAGESTEETDVLQLVADTWKQIGIKLFTKPQTREIMRQRVYSGEAMMTIWSGLENGLARPESDPRELACTMQTVLWCPKFGQHVQTRGRSGEPIPENMKVVRELSDLVARWERATEPAEQERIWLRLLEIHADYQYTIGIVSGVLQPVIVGPRLRNVPKKAVHNWDPGAFLGVHRPDTFWLDRP